MRERASPIQNGSEGGEAPVELRVRLGAESGAPEVAALLIAKGFRLRGLVAEKLNLEEAYLRLTEEKE